MKIIKQEKPLSGYYLTIIFVTEYQIEKFIRRCMNEVTYSAYNIPVNYKNIKNKSPFFLYVTAKQKRENARALKNGEKYDIYLNGKYFKDVCQRVLDLNSQIDILLQTEIDGPLEKLFKKYKKLNKKYKDLKGQLPSVYFSETEEDPSYIEKWRKYRNASNKLLDLEEQMVQLAPEREKELLYIFEKSQYDDSEIDRFIKGYNIPPTKFYIFQGMKRQANLL